MKENLSKRESTASLLQEENLINWNDVLKKLQLSFGNTFLKIPLYSILYIKFNYNALNNLNN